MPDRDLSQPDHLPNLRPGGRPRQPGWLPRQRRGVTPQMIGRYPDYDVLDSRDTWDAATARVIDARMKIRYGDPLSFFSAAEGVTGRAFCDVVLAQDRDPKIPVLELVDRRLAAGQLDGYQYADLPDDRDTWRLVLTGLDETAAERYRQPTFAACDSEAASGIVGHLTQGLLGGGSWEKLNVKRAWSVCSRMIVSAFYSHPWAWNEIGFGGPAYPRGFMRIGPVGFREPYEPPGATNEDPAEVEKWSDR
jgi:hypothetical protein